jgi:hypothetical protein
VYRNGVALWPPLKTGSQINFRREHQRAGMGTGSYGAGDVYSFDVVLQEESGADTVWRKVLRTNAVTVR